MIGLRGVSLRLSGLRWVGLWRIRFRFFALALFALSISLTAVSQEAKPAHRIILKDGSYQAITRYEVKGDRVRYLSAERDEWEELPTSLVDWPATEKYEKERSTAPTAPEAALIDQETAADRKSEKTVHLPEVAPGLHLPEMSGLYLLDNFKGEAQLVEVPQNEGDVDHNTRSNIFRGALGPAASAKRTIEIEGEHASIFSHAAVPSIYINIEDDDEAPAGETASAQPSQPSLDAPRQQAQQPQQAEGPIVPFNRFHIVHLKAKGGKRIVGDIKRAANGAISQDQDTVKSTIDRVGSEGWLKLTPIQDLAPGEYAVVETRGENSMNLYIWPFAVKPDAPANTNPWTAKTN